MTDSLTVMQVLDRTSAARGPHEALRRIRPDGAYEVFTWTRYRDQCRRVARALIALGQPAGKGVAIIGYNCPEWVFADLGAILAGAVPAGIYLTSSTEQCRYIANHCEAHVVFAENRELMSRFLEVRDRLPHARYFVQMFGKPGDPSVLSWDDFLARSEQTPEADLDARIAAQKPDDLCTLIYTSGTTGEPKGVMLTHDNLTWTAAVTRKTIEVSPDDDGVSYLPLNHIAEQLLTIYAPLEIGFRITFSPSLEKLGETLVRVRPSYFVGVPRVWEKIQAKVAAAGQNAPPLRKKVMAWARRKGLEGGYAAQRGEGLPRFYGLADRLVFSKVRERLGLDRCRIAVTSTAPIAKDTLDFFLSLGIPILEVYGMSECTGPGTASTPDAFRTGKVGRTIPGAEIKVAAEDGEVCMRGRHVFKGYYKDPESTALTLDSEGWLHSGDVGGIDADGYLQITDRKKELIITAGGENISPQLIEAELKALPVVSQAVALGDRERFIAALVTLDPERVALEAELAGSPARDVRAAASCEIFRAHLRKQIDAHVNPHLARVQHVRRFEILPDELTIGSGELTPTMKLKRRVIHEKYQTVIRALFAP